MEITKHWSSKQWQDVILLTFLFFICYSLFAGSHPILINDEGRYNEVAREMLQSHNFITPTNNGVLFLDKPPLFYWLQASSFWLFGVNEWAARIWPIVFGWFGCLMTYITSFYLYNRRTAYLSFIILATSPLYFIFGHYANLDLEVAVWIAASLMGFMLAVRDGFEKLHLKPLLFSYICAGLAFMTKGLMGVVFPIMIIGTWIICFNRWRVLRNMYLGSGLLIILAICLPWLIIVQKDNPEFFKYFFYTQQFERYTGSQFNNPEPVTFYLLAIITGILPWTIWLIQSVVLSIKKIRHEKDNLAGFLLLWIGLITVFFSIPVSKINSYILPIFPALALLIGRYAAEKDLSEKYWQWLLCIFSVLVTVAGAILAFLPNKLFSHYDLTHQAQFIGAIILCCFGVFSFIAFYKAKITQRWIALGIVMAIGLTLTDLAISAIHFRPSVKPLVMLINKQITPTDEIVAYQRYYHDLPFYVQKRITVVADWNNPTVTNNDSWSGQIANLLAYQPQARSWLITEPQFWQKWHSNTRLFVLLPKHEFPKFQKAAQPSQVYVLGYYDRVYLVSNQQ